MKKFGIMFGMIAVAALLVVPAAQAQTNFYTNQVGQIVHTIKDDNGIRITRYELPNDPAAILESSDESHRIVPMVTNLASGGWTVPSPFQSVYLVDATTSATGAVIALDNADTNTVSQPFTYEVTFVNVGNSTTNSLTFVDGNASGPLELSGNAVLGQYDTLTLRKVASNRWVEAEQVDNSP